MNALPFLISGSFVASSLLLSKDKLCEVRSSFLKINIYCNPVVPILSYYCPPDGVFGYFLVLQGNNAENEDAGSKINENLISGDDGSVSFCHTVIWFLKIILLSLLAGYIINLLFSV